MWNLNWKYFLIEVLSLLLINVSNIESGCSWEDNSPTSQKYCSIKCNSKNFLSIESIASIMTNLGKEWTKVKKHLFFLTKIQFPKNDRWTFVLTQRPNCSDDGIDLKLENLKYPDDTVKKNFFTAQVKVTQLSLILKNFFGQPSSEKIEIDAFNVDSLKFLKKLEINDITFTPIEKGIFNGLENLEVLNIKGTKLRRIDIGVLDVLTNTLKEFSLEESPSESTEISIEGLTGSGAMEKLENVKFRYNLNTSIARNTLVGLTNVKTLDLSDCKIETIAAGAFDSMSFIEQLKLEDNYLTIIPDGFFDVILIRNRTQIFLKGNRFWCDCNLMPFKMSLIDHSNFVGELLCYKPDKLNSHPLIGIPFCDSYVPPTTTPVDNSTPPSLSEKTCVSSDKTEKSEVVFIETPAQSMQIFETENDGVILRVDQIAKSLVLIWFTSNDQAANLIAGDDINCLISSDGTSFQINNLIKNSAYTFCLMDQIAITVSPLDCISFKKKNDSKALPWLYDNSKSHMIGITLVVYVLNILLGLAIGISTKKLKVLKNNRKKSFVRSYSSSVASSMR